MISRKELDVAEAIVAHYESRTQANMERPDRVYVQVVKEHMLVLVRLARAGLATLRRQCG